MSDLQAAGPKLDVQLSGYLELFQAEYELEFDGPAEALPNATMNSFTTLMEAAQRFLSNSEYGTDALHEVHVAESFTQLPAAFRHLLDTGFTRDREQFAIAREMAGRLAQVRERARVILLAILKLSHGRSSDTAFVLLKRAADLYLAGFDAGTILMCEECLKIAFLPSLSEQGINSQRGSFDLEPREIAKLPASSVRNSSAAATQQRLLERFREERGRLDLANRGDVPRVDSALLVYAELLAELLHDTSSSTEYPDEDVDRRRVSSDAEDATPAARRIENLDRDELICLVRQVFADGVERERADAISELARALGYKRTSAGVSDALDRSMRTAVRRGILDNSFAALRIGARSIDDYERSEIKEQFLASLGGRHWVDRDEAIRDFARWLGFRRTGVAIEDSARSAINGLIREMKLQSDGRMIRRIS